MCPHVVDKKPLPYFSSNTANFYCALQQYASWMLNDSPKQQKTNSHKDIASLKKSPVVGVCPFDPGWVHVQTRVCVCVCDFVTVIHDVCHTMQQHCNNTAAKQFQLSSSWSFQYRRISFGIIRHLAAPWNGARDEIRRVLHHVSK